MNSRPLPLSLPGSFLIHHQDNLARGGEFHTAHGTFQTPAFMPVGTQASVKGLTPLQLRELGAEILLANAYHLHLRPGDEVIRDLGGLHKFMGWDGPILTDSGGFQVFSLAKLREITDEGVSFQSHVDGSKIWLTPEKVVQIQENLGVDIMMVFDECLPYPSPQDQVARSLKRTFQWAERCQRARSRKDVLAFGIVQGGFFEPLRKQAADELTSLDFDGYAIGGVSVGESTSLMRETTQYTTPCLPREKVRYLMGVGMPSDIVYAVGQGVDLFDCVIPTRSARFGRLYTQEHAVNIRNSIFRKDSRPIEEACLCYTCKNFSRAYLSHLIHAKEVLAVQLCTIHNLYYYQALMQKIRSAIEEKRFGAFSESFLSKEVKMGGEGE